MVNLFFRRPSLLFILSTLLCLAGSLWILHLQWHLPPMQLFAAADSLPLEALAVQQNTLPRMAMALLAGGSTAAATMLLQQVMHNPLAADSTLAVGSGAQAALVLATVFTPSLLLHGTPLIALTGSLAALAAVFFLSAQRDLVPLTVILSGLVVSLYLGAVTGILMLFFSEETRGVMQWGAGSLVQDSWHDTLHMLWRTAVALLLCLLLLKPLSVMGLGDSQAESLGIPVTKVRSAALILAAFLSANVVAYVGMMGFTGLAAAAAVRQAGIRTLRARLAASFACGSLLLLFTDNALVLLKHYTSADFPAGSVTALIGAPLLLWLMAKAPSRPVQTASGQIPPSPRTSRLLRLLPLLLGAILLLALFAGRSDSGFTFDSEFFTFRYPRVILAAATGCILALVGVVLQRLMQNPMAGPELLGISSGTALGAMAAILLFSFTSDSLGFWLAGILSALLSLGILMFLNRKNGLQPEKVLLTGMALAALSDAVIRIWTASGDFRIQQLLVWMSGSTYHTTPQSALIMGISAVLFTAAALPLHRWLGLLSLDHTVAQTAGVNVAHARTVLILISAVMTASVTLLIGPLSFIGLIAPHLAFLLGARRPKQQLLAAALIGAGVMTAADWLGRQMLYPYEIPAGLTATLIGGAYFMAVMRKM